MNRWGHTATLHRDRYILIYGGRDNNGYWNTVDVIDIGMLCVEEGRGEREE